MKKKIDKSKFKRNEDGLYDHIDYKYKEDGYIDWKAMIPKEFIVPNKKNFNKLTKKQIEALDVDDLEDKDLIVLLAGIKYIAKIRGFSNCSIKVKSVLEEKTTCECHIIWVPNFETENEYVTFSGIGDASFKNTMGFGQNFLGAMAENRAFVRCVRNFLNVHIVGNDEMADGYALEHAQSNSENKLPPSISPTKLLEKTLIEKNMDFEKLKKSLIKMEETDASEWESIEDIPEKRVMGLVGRLKKL